MAKTKRKLPLERYGDAGDKYFTVKAKKRKPKEKPSGQPKEREARSH